MKLIDEADDAARLVDDVAQILARALLATGYEHVVLKAALDQVIFEGALILEIGAALPALDFVERRLSDVDVALLHQLGHLSVEEGEQESADVLLVHLKDDPLFAITIPSKTQAYMAVGKPVLMAVRGDAATLVEEAGAGFSATPEDAASVADAVCRFAALPREALDAMGARGAAFYQEHLSVRVGVARFGEVFERVVAERRQA